MRAPSAAIAKWQDNNPQASAHGFVDYVTYVQDKWAENQAGAENDRTADLQTLARQMARVDERRAASQFYAQEPVRLADGDSFADEPRSHLRVTTLRNRCSLTPLRRPCRVLTMRPAARIAARKTKRKTIWPSSAKLPKPRKNGRMPHGRCSESEGGRDRPLMWGAPSQRKNHQPGFINDNDAWRSEAAREQQHTPSAGMSAPQEARPPLPVENIFACRTQAGTGKSPMNGAAAIRALFNAVKEMLSPLAEDAPQPARRRRGETGKGFVAACRSILRRAKRHEVSTIGGNASFVDVCAEAGVFLSDTLDPLNPWQDSADNDHWQEEDFSARYWDYFPQP